MRGLSSPSECRTTPKGEKRLSGLRYALCCENIQ